MRTELARLNLLNSSTCREGERMFGTKGNKPQNRIDCLIGAGTRIEGNVIFSGGLRIDGHVRGSIVAEEGKPGTLVVSERAQIDGEIRAPHVVINGAVNGPVT